jgi:hypothetical protein
MIDGAPDWDVVSYRDNERINVLVGMLKLGLDPDKLASVTASVLADFGYTKEKMEFYIELAQARINAEGS